MAAYQDYIDSPKWRELKLKYRASGKPWECKICQSKKDLSLHHRTYETLGHEDISKDVVCVCQFHHSLIHWDDKLGKTPLDYKHLLAREKYLYRRYHGFWAYLGRIKLGSLINKVF